MLDLYGNEMYCRSKMEERFKEAEEQRVLYRLEKAKTEHRPSLILSCARTLAASLDNVHVEIKLDTVKIHIDRD